MSPCFRKSIPSLFGMLVILSLVIASCTPATTPAPVVDTATSAPTHIQITPTATATSVPLPAFSLDPNQLYFSMDGKPTMLYSRNVMAIFPEDYGTLFDWSAAGGTRVIRFGMSNFVMGGYFYTNTGELDEKVVANFEKLLDDAQAHGLSAIIFFTGWGEWNSDADSDWAHNPFNAANGGPTEKPIEVFTEGTVSNRMWFAVVEKLLRRWGTRENIVAWEVLGEGNLITGITEKQGIAFVEKMAATVHAVDPFDRPITASLGGDISKWPDFFRIPAIDFVQVHPYWPTNTLDRDIVRDTRQHITRYNKPVLIGESGLNFDPMKDDLWISASPNAHIAIEHAVWAGVVSGSMNARSLYWEDSYAIFFPKLRAVWMNQYAELERPAARFTSGVDFTDFKPLTVHLPVGTKIWGAAVGNEKMVLGWFRDAACEPPDWKLLPLISGQTVSVEVPGQAENWQVDFYDTKTGNALEGSALLTRNGKYVIVSLPEFTDDIAFKLFVNTTGAVLPPPAPLPDPTPIALTGTNPAAGKWIGTIFGEQNDFAAVVNVIIKPGCKTGEACGQIRTEACSLILVLKEVKGDTLTFSEKKASNTSTCPEGGIDRFTLQPNGTIIYRYEGNGFVSSGMLHRP